MSGAFPLPEKPIQEGDHILVVDDTPAMANLIAGYLREAGYKVETVHSAEEAWESLLQRLPILITVDDFLPGADSWKLLRCVRHLKYSWDIPMIRLGDKQLEWSGLLENGPAFDMMLFKPFVPQELIYFVDRMSAFPNPEMYPAAQERLQKWSQLRTR
jgi:DNA-binding response OmpR family regulator